MAQATGTPATLTPRPLNALPMLSGFTCGAVEVRDNRVSNPADARAAEDCFWAAYQQCAINAGMAVREST
ncbi:MAG: hypothetical protein M3008_06200, partial [Chloroflexota bacterium]|nr:hypothetical protein [Chloroflexota bacterium]